VAPRPDRAACVQDEEGELDVDDLFGGGGIDEGDADTEDEDESVDGAFSTVEEQLFLGLERVLTLCVVW